MKIWVGYGSEHSANLVIIGTFENSNDAGNAHSILEELTQIAEQDEKTGHLKPEGGNIKFSEALLDYCLRTNFNSFGHDDPAQLLYENKAIEEGNRLIITTDELDIGAFIKIMLHKGAKIEVYSAHEHGGGYGRRTKTD